MTFALLTIPCDLMSTQVWPAGCAEMPTSYSKPFCTTSDSVNVVAPEAGLALRVGPFSILSPAPVRPLIVPPIV